MTPKNIGTPNKIREFRARYKITQADLAEIGGVSQQTIARWESGKSEIPLSSLKGLAAKIGCPLEELITLDDPTSNALRKLSVTRSFLSGTDDDILPWGTASVHLGGIDDCVDFPIDYGSYINLTGKLRGGEKLHQFEGFATMDNLLVHFNSNHLKAIHLVNDNDEEMPDFFHDEVYRALTHVDYAEDIADELNEISDTAIDFFSDLNHKGYFCDDVTVVTVSGSRYRSEANDDAIKRVISTMYSDNATVLEVSDYRRTAKNFIALNQIIYITIPLLRYKLMLYDVQGDEFYPF